MDEEEGAIGWTCPVGKTVGLTPNCQGLRMLGRMSRSYANTSTQIPTMTDELTPGKKVGCFITFVLDPSHFFARPFTRTEEYQSFAYRFDYVHAGLRSEWGPKMTNGPTTSYPRPSLLKVGMFIAVKHENQWTRGRIVRMPERPKGEDLYKVHLIDIGPAFSVHFDQIQLLLTDFINIPAFTFNCCLYVEFKNREPTIMKWNEEQTFLFTELFRDEPLRLSFMQEVPDTEGKVWMVKVDMLEKYVSNQIGLKVLSHKKLCKHLMDRKAVRFISAEQETPQ